MGIPLMVYLTLSSHSPSTMSTALTLLVSNVKLITNIYAFITLITLAANGPFPDQRTGERALILVTDFHDPVAALAFGLIHGVIGICQDFVNIQAGL